VTRRTGGSRHPELEKSALIRELVDLSRFTDDILRTMGSAVFSVDGDGTIVYLNPAAEVLFGKPASAMLRRPAGEVLTTRGGGDLIAFAREYPTAWGEVDLEFPGGRIVTVDARVSPQKNEDGAEAGFVVILTDLTEIKQAQEQARHKERLASLGELAAGVAHEIRNPLAGIGAGAQLLRSRLGTTDRNGRLVEVILEETQRLERIVGSLLKFGRPVQPKLQQASIVASLEKAVELVAPRIADRSIDLETTYDPELPAIWIDPDQLEQVFLNLLGNAVDAMDGGGRLGVSARKVSRPPYVRRSRGRRREDRSLPPPGQPQFVDWIEVEIRDSGHGVAPEDMGRIFNPFYTTRPSGTGLGLAICQSIVQEHAGMIRFDSEEGRGTSVLVDLPVEKRHGPRRRR